MPTSMARNLSVTGMSYEGCDTVGCSPSPVIADPCWRPPANRYNRPYEQNVVESLEELDTIEGANADNESGSLTIEGEADDEAIRV
jgi:hypothetical protein